MKKHELIWHVGKEGTQRTRLDVPPFRAYFTWLEDGQVVRSVDFDKKELETEIARLVDSGEESAPFKDALKELAQ